MHATPLPRFPDYSVISTADTKPAAARPTIAEQKKSDQVEKTAQVREQVQEEVKKVARAKLAPERKQAVLARLREQHEERENALAFGYANQPFNAPTFSPFGQRAEY